MNDWHCLILFLTLVPLTAFGQTIDPDTTVELLTKEMGGKVIAGPDDDTFFGKLYPREAATMTGVPRDEKTADESRSFAREFFRNAVMEFTADETTAMRAVVSRLDQQFGDQYPLLIRRPWRFIKTRADLCGSFSFTRADCIVISQPTLKSIAEAPDNPKSMRRAEELFLHEQMHVLQRARPELFADLYKNVCGFRQADVRICQWINERQVTNPDGVDDNWIFNVKSEGDSMDAYWIGTILVNDKTLHRMGRDFTTVAVPVHQSGPHYIMPQNADKSPQYTKLEDMTGITSRLPLPPHYDHVNEVGAYLFTSITHNRPNQPKLLSQSANDVQRKGREWFAENLTPNRK